MTTSNVEEIVDQIKLATDYQINKRVLREKILTELHMPYENGLFKITPELIAFVTVWDRDILYLEDVYQNPIKVSKDTFLIKAKQHYQSVMNEWHQQHEELKRIRKV